MPFNMFNPNEYEASCAVCGEPAEGECSSNCESARLHMAIDRAEAQWLDKWREKTREWVANNAVRYVTNTFSAMKEARLENYRAHIRALPYFNLYEQYGGRPPLPPQYVANLHRQIREADLSLRRNIDDDWKSCVIRYPEVLNFFYSQVNMVTPKVPETPSVLKSSIPSFNMPQIARPMSANPATRSTTGSASISVAAAQSGLPKKSRRKSVTMSTGPARSDSSSQEDQAMAMLSKMLEKKSLDPYSRPSTTANIVGPFKVPMAPEPPGSRIGKNTGKRMSRDYSMAAMMSGGIPRAPIVPSGNVPPYNEPYRPDGGPFGM